jgi:hypothetical protein
MGHADFTNISKAFVKALKKRESVTISEVVKELVEKGEAVHASEGLLEDSYMISYALEEIVRFLYCAHGVSDRTPPHKRTPVIRPAGELTDRQNQLIQEWFDGDADWDCGEDGSGGEYGEFDKIPWEFTPEWKNRKSIPLLTNFEN